MSDFKETSKLYECRNCGGIAASKQLSCPYCEHSQGPTVERNCIGGGTEEITKNWYRIVELVNHE